MKIRVFLIDDEPLARERIRFLLKDDSRIEIVGEFDNGNDAITAVERDHPDLLFLDVQMPEMDGFQMLKSLRTDPLPAVIFTTAYDQHALKAFEHHALDYLLKPIQPDRLKAAVDHALKQVAERTAGQAAKGLLDLLGRRDTASGTGYLTRLCVRVDDRTIVVKTCDIDSIESAGNYVVVHSGKENHVLRETLASLESQLDPEKFLRISRSAMVNLDRVRELQPMFKGEHVIVLENGKQLAVTRGVREVERALKYS